MSKFLKWFFVIAFIGCIEHIVFIFCPSHARWVYLHGWKKTDTPKYDYTLKDKIYIMPTIDVEAIKDHKDLGDFNKLISQVNSMDSIFLKYNIKGTFLIDVAEPFEWQIVFDKLKRHDLQLHIHPNFISDKDRLLMWEYSSKEQCKIINECLDRFKEYRGNKPEIFRAGAYGADDNTLKCLVKNNIKCDMSYFKDHKNCKIKKIPKGLIEVPVSVFRVFKRYRKGDETVFLDPVLKKFDIDFDTEFVMNCLREAKDTERKYLVLFMHNYSDLDKLEKFFKETVNDEQIIYVTAKEYLELRGMI